MKWKGTCETEWGNIQYELAFESGKTEVYMLLSFLFPIRNILLILIPISKEKYQNLGEYEYAYLYIFELV